MVSGHTLSLMKWVQLNLTVTSTGAYNAWREKGTDVNKGGES